MFNGKLTENEVNLLKDVSNGILYDPMIGVKEFLIAEIEDAVMNLGIDRKWGVDFSNLIKKINETTDEHVLEQLINSL
jgi:hypothetical protein